MNTDNLKTLSEIFSRDNLQIIVPDFQRGYSWGKQQLEDLWEDLYNIRSNCYHYTGMLTFSMIDKGKGIYNIIDGQQRLTTLIILINEILKKIEGGIEGEGSKDEFVSKYLYKKTYGALNYVYRLSYCSDNPSDEFFKTKILENKSTSSPLVPQNTLYTSNLAGAKDFFVKKMESFNKSQLDELFIRVVKQLKFNEYVIDDIDNVYVTFETMNNRGKELSTLELLKNRLIYLTTLFKDSEKSNADTLRKNINDVWKTIYCYLGKNPKIVLDDDTFLRDHWIMYYKYDRTISKAYKYDLLHERFTAKKVISKELSVEEINNYIISLQDSVECWFSIFCPEMSNRSIEVKQWLERLQHVGIGSFRPLIMAALQNNDKNHLSLIALLKACEDFRFKVSCVTGRRSNTSDTHFYKLASELYNNKEKSLYDCTDDVHTQTNTWTDVDTFVKNMREKYEKGDCDGFYSWNGIRYFLYEYEENLAKNNDKKLRWDIFVENQKDKISIEHIYPQTDTNEYWQCRFTDNDDKCLCHSLGNLLLLSQRKNSTAQNDPFMDKRELYRNGSQSEIEVSKCEEWNPSEIVKRGLRLLSFMENHWNLKLTQQQKMRLLNVSENSIYNKDGSDLV